MPRVRTIGIVLVALAICGLLGCSGRQASTAPTGGPAIAIQAHAYVPRTLTVKPGATVTWTNDDSITHIVSGTTFISGEIKPGASYSHTFEQAGTYNYIDTADPSFVGVITVQ